MGVNFPKQVRIVEVGPRDGLQNESQSISAAIKVDFINRLSDTGLSTIEVTSFVSPKWIPQLADHAEVYALIEKKPGISYPVFVPNLLGLKKALEVGVKDIAIFSTPSELFCQKNINCSVAENLARIKEVIELAKHHHIRVRGYISCVLGCPYEGKISPESVANLAKQLIELGCYEISLGDTIGVGTPYPTQSLLQVVRKSVSVEQLAVHFHDTYGQALANIYVALENGIAVIDSSVGGLGGCPYAKGASGNVATEDVLYMLDGMQIRTGIDLQKMINVSEFITKKLGRNQGSKVSKAMGNNTVGTSYKNIEQ